MKRSSRPADALSVPSVLRPVGTVPPASARRDFRAGFWRLADPKISLASFASMLVGAAAAAAHGPLHIGWLAWTVFAVFAIEVAKNASGEVVDGDSGVDRGVSERDRSPFSGGKRVLVDGLLSRRGTVAIAIAGYATAAMAGAWIVLVREPLALPLGVLGLALAFFYHAPPLRLAYRGLGELSVAAVYGPLIAAATYLVQRGTIHPHVIAVATPLGIMIGAFLWINEFPDYHADRAAGKRTLVVRLGRDRAAATFAVIIASAYTLLAVLPFAGVTRLVWMGAIGAVPAARAARIALATPQDTQRLIPAQVATLLSFLLLALGMAAGLLLS